MKYMTGNIMDLLGRPAAICITTNGFVKARGDAVMGMGIAKSMAEKFVELPHILGRNIKANGNVVQYLMHHNGTALLSFPVKPASKVCKYPTHDMVKHAVGKYPIGSTIPGFHCKADPEIIHQSCLELMDWMDKSELEHCVIPVPGCGAGELSYLRDVKHICESILDDRIWMCSFNKSDFIK